MNDLELISRLKNAPVPGRPAGYWEEFPAQVRRQLHRKLPAATAQRRPWRIRLIWACDFALTTALVLFCLEYHPLQSTVAAINRHEQYFHAQLAQLDKGMHRLVLNTDGMGYLLADAN